MRAAPALAARPLAVPVPGGGAALPRPRRQRRPRPDRRPGGDRRRPRQRRRAADRAQGGALPVLTHLQEAEGCDLR